MRYSGVVARGIRMPLIKEGTDIVPVIADTLAKAAQEEKFSFKERGIIGVTESLVARSQGNFVTLKDISVSVAGLFPEGDVTLFSPIFSRNRFLPMLKGIVAGIKGKVNIVFSLPSDEVGNPSCADPYAYQEGLFGEDSPYFSFVHPITGMNYPRLYKEIDPQKISIFFVWGIDNFLKYFNSPHKQVLVCTVHNRQVYAKKLAQHGFKVHTLADICAAPVRPQAGFNADFGLLGSNYSNEDRVKLFPRDCQNFVNRLHKAVEEKTGVRPEVLIYGDGAYKDPSTGIWELADPLVSPAATSGLCGMPHETKLKSLIDSGADVRQAVQTNAGGQALGTTPRRLTDLLGSLCDLTSGSGDKGTPVIYITGYFDNYYTD